MIYEAVDNMKKKGQQEVKLPDLKEDIEKKVSFFKVRGTLSADGGWFRDLTSLKRTGPVLLEEGDDSLTVGLELALEDMEFGFKNYRAEVFHVGMGGQMSVRVGKNSLKGKVTMHFDGPKCHTHVDDIELTQLGQLDIHLTGLGRDGDLVYNLLANYLANRFKDKIKKEINRHLADPIRAALAKKDICEKFPH
ncbi:hypothetical protein AAG570_011727 [Ranatra chinensis]|uniref:Uncharacterized protein n=1 Tax=Ranatra chinensis TaxID=642074 RepID=A0ABD0YH62_9HEMI